MRSKGQCRNSHDQESTLVQYSKLLTHTVDIRHIIMNARQFLCAKYVNECCILIVSVTYFNILVTNQTLGTHNGHDLKNVFLNILPSIISIISLSFRKILKSTAQDNVGKESFHLWL